MSRNSVLEAGAKFGASLAKWLSVRLQTKCFWVRVQLQSISYISEKMVFLEKLAYTNFSDDFH